MRAACCFDLLLTFPSKHRVQQASKHRKPKGVCKPCGSARQVCELSTLVLMKQLPALPGLPATGNTACSVSAEPCCMSSVLPASRPGPGSRASLRGGSGVAHMTDARRESRVVVFFLFLFFFFPVCVCVCVSGSSLCTVGSQLTDRMWGGLCHQRAGRCVPGYAGNYTVPRNLLLMSGCRQPEHIEIG